LAFPKRLKPANKEMNRTLEKITIREVEPSDLETFFAHQLDPEAIRMAAFVCKDPNDRAAFDAHWKKILNSPQNINRTIVAGGHVAGHVACYPDGEHLEVTYWLGREFWGRGLATQALQQMLKLVAERPVFARAAADNPGSLKVLQKCGFKITGKDSGFANGRGEQTEEYLLRLASKGTVSGINGLSHAHGGELDLPLREKLSGY
jgi:RimJ/RimL family protein N-acetyltransferase